MSEDAPRHGARPRVALVLPGGGARSAYQVGVLQAIAGWCPPGRPLPFPILCGTSAGAINAAVLAAHGGNVQRAAADLARVWGGFHIEQVFRAGAIDMLRSGLHLLLALVSGGWLLPMPRALFDNTPLRELLAASVDFDALQRALEDGVPDSIAITATSVTRGDSVTFVATSRPFTPWERAGRRGVAAQLGVDHLMASSAIPLLFPAVAMAEGHYGDGAMRQSTPLAPAIHLGADRILVIGVRQLARAPAIAGPAPNMAEQFGFMLDSLFMEGLQADLERLARINTLLARLPPGPAPLGLRRVETLLVLPQRDPSEIALAHRMAMPGTLRALLRILGATGVRGGRLLSYLMFESRYTQEMIRLGERDATARRAEISAFLGLECEAAAG
jgi:NTE family protein